MTSTQANDSLEQLDRARGRRVTTQALPATNPPTTDGSPQPPRVWFKMGLRQLGYACRMRNARSGSSIGLACGVLLAWDYSTRRKVKRRGYVVVRKGRSRKMMV